MSEIDIISTTYMLQRRALTLAHAILHHRTMLAENAYQNILTDIHRI